MAINRASVDEFEHVYGVRPQVGDSIVALLVHRPKNQAGARAIWSRALAGESFTTLVEVRVPVLSTCHYELRLNALRDQNGRLIGAYQFGYDGSDRLRDEARLANAERRLRQAQKIESIGQLTGGLAHDFNNLLQTVQGNLQLISRVPNDAKRVLQWAENGLTAVRRGADLTLRLLSFAREQKLELHSIVIANLVGGLADMLQRALGPLVRLALIANSAEAAVAADATQLEMAVLNLAINARDAMPGGGTLTITTPQCSVFASDDLPAGDYVELRVADNGSGMSAEIAARAFDLFFTTNQGCGQGHGAGLEPGLWDGQATGRPRQHRQPVGQRHHGVVAVAAG